MVARGLKRPVDAAEDTAALVLDQRKLAVNRRGSPDDFAAEGLANGLVPKADPENRDRWGGLGNQLKANAGVIRRARAGREHDCVWVGRNHLATRYFVIAMNGDLRPEATEIVEQVEGKAVVVVDEDDHGSRACSSSETYSRAGVKASEG